ncbi:MAG TPA: GTP 3',8-cyclase MoaA [Polyangia bacterium]|nr:GTP 3',8-cyclase MoaA [Polyangia bacterium]
MSAEPAPPLIDPQLRRIDTLRVSVTDRCNYRCTYCMPAGGVPHGARAESLTFEETAALVGLFVRLGIRRVRLTGGEPTVRRDLTGLVRRLRAIGGLEEIALSTNGHLLSELAVPLREAGLDRLNVSLDSLRPEAFARITGGGDLARVLDGLEAAARAGFSAIKVNAVAIEGFNDVELVDLCRFAWSRGWIPRFIEEMPMAGGQTYLPGRCLPAATIRALIAGSEPGGRVIADDGGTDRGAGPARYFRLVRPDDDGAVRRFGIISPMTEHFCDSCNRLRLSTVGALHACLGHDDAVDLRAPLRAGDLAAVERAVRAGVSAKRPGHTFQLVGLGGPRKAMVQIGG